VSFSDSNRALTSKGGGNGEPTDGKPGEYYRWIDGYRCKGLPTLIGRLKIKDNELSAQRLDTDTCKLVDEPVTPQMIHSSQLDPSMIGFGSGIFVRSSDPVDPAAAPEKAVETWCRGEADAVNEVVIRNNARTHVLTLQTKFNGLAVSPSINVTRQMSSRAIEYRAGMLSLKMDRVTSLAGSEVRAVIRSSALPNGSIDLKCRTGSMLDVYNHFSPLEQFTFFGPALPADVTLRRSSSGTYVDSSGLLRLAPSDTPRFDFDETGLSRGLLVEKTSTNLLLNSGDLEQWTNSGMSITANSALAPTGIGDAELIRHTPANAYHQIKAIFSPAPNAFYTFSAYLKPVATQPQRLVRLQLVEPGDSNNGFLANFDILNGQVDAVTGIPQGRGTTAGVERLANGWLRVFVSGIPNGKTPGISFEILLESVQTSLGTSQFSDPSQSGFYVWGAQLEPGESMSSYIATTTGPASRAADQVSMTNLAWWDNAAPNGFSLMFEKVVPTTAVKIHPSLNQVNPYLSLLTGGAEILTLFFDRTLSRFTSAIQLPSGSSVSIDAPDITTRIAPLKIFSIATFTRDSMSVSVDGLDAEGVNVSGASFRPDQLQLSSDSLGGLTEHLQAFRYWPFQLEPEVRAPLTTEQVPK
jgi:hypothetical protein